jgi:hypothetical protein
MSSEQFVAPVDIGGRKSCYIWDLEAREITVLDPSLMKSPKSRIKKTHEEIAVNLTGYLCDCMHLCYPEWKVDRFDMGIVYLNDVSRASRWSDMHS